MSESLDRPGGPVQDPPGPHRATGGTRWWRWLVGLLLSAGALWLAVYEVDWRQTIEALSEANYALLVLACSVQGAAFVPSALRWRYLFVEPDRLSLGGLARVLMVAHLVNTVVPFRLGPLARAFLVRESEGVAVATVLATVAGEKLLEMLSLTVGLSLVLLVMPLPDWVRQSGLVVAILALAGVAAIVLLSRFGGQMQGWLARWQVRVAAMVQGMLDTLATWTQPMRVVHLVGWTAVIVALGTAINYLVLVALDLPARLQIAFVLLVLLQLGARVPAGPANIGVFELLCVVGLGWYGVDAGRALSYGLILHITVLLPGLLGGGWALLVDTALPAGLRAAQRGKTSS